MLPRSRSTAVAIAIALVVGAAVGGGCRCGRDRAASVPRRPLRAEGPQVATCRDPARAVLSETAIVETCGEGARYEGAVERRGCRYVFSGAALGGTPAVAAAVVSIDPRPLDQVVRGLRTRTVDLELEAGRDGGTVRPAPRAAWLLVFPDRRALAVEVGGRTAYLEVDQRLCDRDEALALGRRAATALSAARGGSPAK